MINSEQLNHFREIYKQKYGQEIDHKTAQEIATKLLILAKNIYKSVPKIS